VRVAVRHTDKKHHNHDWFAYEFGRILGFTHPITGETFTADQQAEAMLGRAREQYPEEEGYEHRIETLHVAGQDEDGHDIGEWHPIGKSKLPRAGAGGTAAHDLTATQGQEGSD
jgi:hypothetical protein